MRRLRVELGPRSYPLFIGSGILGSAGRILASVGFQSHPIVVSNARVLRLHGKCLLRSLESTFGRVSVIRIGGGERHKNHGTVARIYQGLLHADADRRSWIIAFGGGVIGDVAGFAAATFMRGIPHVVVPTTLLAQVDSSLGGKVGINLPQGKNLIGAFHQPHAVISDTGILRTLPARELASGLFEVVKCGAIRSRPLLEYLGRKLPAVLRYESAAIEHVVLTASRIKAELVSADEGDGDARMALNYGHTLGHALEAATDYRRFKHGEAVAWGMIAAAELACSMGTMKIQDAEYLTCLIRRLEHLPSLRGISSRRVWDALQRDKKFRDGRIRVVLVPQIGRTEIVEDVNPRWLLRFIAGFVARHSQTGRAGTFLDHPSTIGTGRKARLS